MSVTRNAINPGGVDTGWMDEAIRASCIRSTPAGRLSTADGTADLVDFHLSGQECMDKREESFTATAASRTASQGVGQQEPHRTILCDATNDHDDRTIEQAVGDPITVPLADGQRCWHPKVANVRLSAGTHVRIHITRGSTSNSSIVEDDAGGPGRLIPHPARQLLISPRNTEALRWLALIAEGHTEPLSTGRHGKRHIAAPPKTSLLQ